MYINIIEFINRLQHHIEEVQRKARGLVAMGEWLNDHPLVPVRPHLLDFDMSVSKWQAGIYNDALDSNEWLDTAMDWLREGQGFNAVRKLESEYKTGIVVDFVGAELEVYAPAEEVCRFVPTGETTERVTYEVPEEVREQYKVVRTVPVTEKICPPVLRNAR